MEWHYPFALTFLLACIYLFGKRRRHSKMPPSPKGLPILGHLHLLGALPHQALARLAKLHGPLMSLRLGRINAVVVSSKEMAMHFLKTQDLAFASRPNTAAARIMGFGPLTMGFVEYGEHWRMTRKLCTLELFTQKRLQESQQLRKEEITWALSSILEEGNAGRPVDLGARLCTLSTNFVTRMAFGKRFLGEGCDAARAKSFHQLIREEFFLFGAQNLGDSFPALAWLDVQGYERRMKASHKSMDRFLEAIIDEHIAERSPNRDSAKPSNLLEILLSKEELSRKHVKAVILDILSGGSDTSPVTVQWALSELVRSPEIMEKLQQEIGGVVGKDRVVVEDDIPSLVYLQAVVKETFRLHPPGPLLIPHESTQDCKVAGFEIPKGTRLIVNAYAIGRDPNVWEDATEFKPERFINDPRDVKGRDFELIPFGSGRRMCPAMPLGLLMVQIFLARFVQSFNWALPGGQKPQTLDMDETFGLNAFRASPLVLVPTPRLSPELITNSTAHVHN